jgi:4-amino-4-deoxy-L-arabinose transferase-like glycosyltransferase
MLLTLPWIAKRNARYLPVAAGLLAFAVLAKSLVPLVLAAPLVLYYRQFRDLLRVRVWLPFLAIVLPWHVLCFARNGRAFTDELFWKHQFQRATSASLMHVQPWYYYAPILIALLLPWSPLLPLLGKRGLYSDPRRRFLIALVVWGFVFFSASLNKLPGYLLPLFPIAAALIGIALEEAQRARVSLAVSALLLVIFPVAATLLPALVATGGLSKTAWPEFHLWWLLPVILIPVVWILDQQGRRLAAVACIAAGATLGTIDIKNTAARELDRIPSARALWTQVGSRADEVCVDRIDRGLQYSLNYYAGLDLPECARSPKPLHIGQTGGRPYLSQSTGANHIDQQSVRGVLSTLRD